MLPGMEARDLTITLDLRVDEESITGRATDGAGQAREFSGRLGLITAIESLMDELLAATKDSQPKENTHANETRLARLSGAGRRGGGRRVG
jgi:hypothetical protein